jgi:hypothetical protein
MGPFDPFALLRGLRMPEMPKARRAPVQYQSDLPRQQAQQARYEYEPIYGTPMGGGAGYSPWEPGQGVGGLAPVTALGYKRVRVG